MFLLSMCGNEVCRPRHLVPPAPNLRDRTRRQELQGGRARHLHERGLVFSHQIPMRLSTRRWSQCGGMVDSHKVQTLTSPIQSHIGQGHSPAQTLGCTLQEEGLSPSRPTEWLWPLPSDCFWLSFSVGWVLRLLRASPWRHIHPPW